MESKQEMEGGRGEVERKWGEGGGWKEELRKEGEKDYKAEKG